MFMFGDRVKNVVTGEEFFVKELCGTGCSCLKVVGCKDFSNGIRVCDTEQSLVPLDLLVKV